MHSSANNYGSSFNSSTIFIRPGYAPKIVGYPTISSYGVNVEIDFYSTFSSSYTVDSFEVLFLSSSNNWYELPIYCGPGLSSFLSYRYCSIPTEAFLDYPLFLDNNDKI